MSSDPLAEISGIKPKRYLKDGEQVEVQSKSSSGTYAVKRVDDHYYCKCRGWTFAGRSHPVDARTCKHLKELLGEEYEKARLAWKNPQPNGGKASGSSSRGGKTTASAGGKRKKPSEDEDEDEDDGNSRPKRRKPASSKPASSAPGPRFEVMLAHSWKEDKGPDPTGWWISEKLDGVRAYYNGSSFYSRLNNEFAAPDTFKKGFPTDVWLDGELFVGRGKFQEAVSIVRSANSPRWDQIKYYVFDIPSLEKPFEQRMQYLRDTFGEPDAPKYQHIVVVEQTKAKDKDHVLEKLDGVHNKGGEGLMLRRPESMYEKGRTNTLLKVKTFYDAEARIIKHHKGSGKNARVMGAIECVMASGKTFKIGSGFTDKQRQNPPKVGTIVVYKFQEYTKSMVPRFPTYVGEAIDKTEPKDAVPRDVGDDDQAE